MTQGARPHRWIAERIKALRKQRGLTAEQLGEEMTKLGFRWDRSIVANLENGRRAAVNVEEMFALAYVLDVAPVHLIVPMTDDTAYDVTPTLTVPARTARQWVRGFSPLPGRDARRYGSEVPEDEFPKVITGWTNDHSLIDLGKLSHEKRDNDDGER